MDGLKILGFDKETVKKVSKEKNLEEIFLSTLFLNYLIILVVYMVGIIQGGFWIEGREINMPVLFGILMIYPFMYNIIVYAIYGFFGLMAELINSHKRIKPLISVGFHTAIVYSIIIFVIGLLASMNTQFGLILLTLFVFWFLYTMFVSISTLYGYSFGQTLIVLFLPFLLLGIVILIVSIFYPNIIKDCINLFYI